MDFELSVSTATHALVKVLNMKYLESGSQTGSEWQDDLLSGRQNLGTSNHRGRETRSATYGSHSEDGHTITQVVGIDRANFKSVVSCFGSIAHVSFGLIALSVR